MLVRFQYCVPCAEVIRCRTGLAALVKLQAGGVVSVLPFWPGRMKYGGIRPLGWLPRKARKFGLLHNGLRGMSGTGALPLKGSVKASPLPPKVTTSPAPTEPPGTLATPMALKRTQALFCV